MNKVIENPATYDRRKQQGVEIKNAETVERLRLNDIRWVMDDPRGRRFISEIFSKCKRGKDPSHATSSEMYKNVGMQKVGMLLEEDLKKASFENWIILLREIEDCGKIKTLDSKGA